MTINGLHSFRPMSDLAVELDRKTWTRLLTKCVTVTEALEAGDLNLTSGDEEALTGFLAYFGA